jgi:hypothetical protein
LEIKHGDKIVIDGESVGKIELVDITQIREE